MKRYTVKICTFIFAIVFCAVIFCFFGSYTAYAKMPFYDLQPKEIQLRACFYTSFSTSSKERKDNINLASKSLDNVLVDSGCEFSFNDTVGARTLARGYKQAKIIFDGKFIDGVGGGVCQVSTTLYNAVLLAGLSVTEYHSHSLPVSYIAPSFDAMVNSGSADLKFINNTHNPIIIKTECNRSTIKVSIFGEKMQEKIVRKSVIVKQLKSPQEEIIVDSVGEFPDLSYGEKRVLAYSKAGFLSEGYLVTVKDGNLVDSKKIRSDEYGGIRGKIVVGGIPKSQE